MPAHTPGPWKGQQHGDDYIMKGANGERVFSIRNGVIPMNEDARLIAAAPRMLEFITEIAARGYVANQIVAARAILREIEGQRPDVEGESNG